MVASLLAFLYSHSKHVHRLTQRVQVKSSKEVGNLGHVKYFEETEVARHRLLIKLAARCTTAPVLPANVNIFLERLRLMIPPPIKCDTLINLPGIHQVGVFAQDAVTFQASHVCALCAHINQAPGGASHPCSEACTAPTYLLAWGQGQPTFNHPWL